MCKLQGIVVTNSLRSSWQLLLKIHPHGIVMDLFGERLGVICLSVTCMVLKVLATITPVIPGKPQAAKIYACTVSHGNIATRQALDWNTSNLHKTHATMRHNLRQVLPEGPSKTCACSHRANTQACGLLCWVHLYQSCT